MKVLLVLALLAYLQPIRSERRCCRAVNECFTDDPPFDNVPVTLCKNEVNPYAKLYTRGGNRRGTTIDPVNTPPNFSSSRRTIIISHGFMNQGNSYWMNDVRKAILNKYDVNVIQIGWEDGSQTIDYPQAAGNTRLVGAYVALIARNLVARHGAAQADLWCVGHSLGSHVCGHAGSRIKFGRITGLDPAGPLYDDADIRAGLHPGAADYVDVIHTMGKSGVILDFGTLRPRGHADFYPNGGEVQPGCINYRHAAHNPKSLAPYVDVSPVCSHMRAIDYFEESVKASCVFWANEQCSDEKNLPGSCSFCGSRCARMGYNSDTIGKRGKFYLTTNEESPFCQG